MSRSESSSPKNASVYNLLLWLIFPLIVGGCATYSGKTTRSQSLFYSGDFEQAANELEAKSKEPGRDQLLYLFDRGMALQLAGRYKESEQDWIKADKMSEVKDYTSISAEAATLLTSDNIKDYKGEDFEKVIINAFNAINYLMENNYEEALVECRIVNQKLYKYKNEAKLDYEQNPFARYLSAMIWEASKKYDDAYIDYVETQKLVPDFPYLKKDLIRVATKLGRTDAVEKWKQEYPRDFEVSTSKEMKKLGEVILIYQQGKSAYKRARPENFRYPMFVKQYSDTQYAILEADEKKEATQKIYSVSDTAIKTLNEAYAGLVAKKAAGLVAKAVVSDQISQKNKLLGSLSWIAMNIADQADLRHWISLPDSLQIARMHVKPGKQTVKVIGYDASMNPSGEDKVFEVNVKAGQKVFLNWRSLR